MVDLDTVLEPFTELKFDERWKSRPALFSGFLPSTFCIRASKQETTCKPPIWEINKISSEILDKLECGKFETKRAGGVLWGPLGGEQQQSSPEMGVMKDSALRPFSPLTSAVGDIYKIHKFLHISVHLCTLFSEKLNSVLYCWLGWW